MKKVFSLLMILFMCGGIFAVVLHNTHSNVKEDAPVAGCVLDYLTPAVAYADSDTVNGPGGEPPPPPPIN